MGPHQDRRGRACAGRFARGLPESARDRAQQGGHERVRPLRKPSWKLLSQSLLFPLRLHRLMPSVAVSAHLLPAIANLRRSAARIFLVLIGGGAIVWGALTLPMFWQQSK